jgi:hypothetical protein
MALNIYYPGECPTSTGGYTNYCCTVKELGRISSVFLFTDAFAGFSDPTASAEWTTGILAGTIIAILDVRGSSDGGVWTEEDGFGRKPVSVTAFEETITFTDQNYIQNVANWNALAKGTYKMAYMTETKCFMFDQSASIKPTKPVSEDPKSAVYGVIEMKVVQSEMPVPFTYPQSIVRCFAVEEV